MTATLVGPQEPLLAAVKRLKLAWFGHVISHQTNLSVKGYDPGHASGKSPSKPLEFKLNGQCERVDISPHG
ncbi:hypothetical protein DPMN_108175 [Dreissena polymorpha]|uniref:Uncharacterized protein n=1 Tax=Dreissena polymorpha TaxID=45954 RepID=A0A9D4QLS1_DREPO|nr:hypothetical protein DPMN_108175 [Dreissena polymorpha]